MDNYFNLLDGFRRDLHFIPELGLDLPLTQKYIREYLIKWGYEPKEVAGSGLVAFKAGSIGNKTYAFRADMDALPIDEIGDENFISKHEGRMHACGHDGHMAILLGFAKYLSEFENLKENVLLIFQPGEETPGGARLIVESGLFDEYKVDGIFGLHLFPDIEEGMIAIKEGPQMAQCGELHVSVSGKAGHCAMPHTGNDALMAAAKLISSYPDILSKKISPLAPAVIHVGTISGGYAQNAIADLVEFHGTVRTFSKEVFTQIQTAVESLNNSIELCYGVSIISDLEPMYPPVINDKNLANLLQSILPKEDQVLSEARMTAEDFSFYQEKVPGLFFFVGTKNEEFDFTNPLHHSSFNFSSNALVKGLETYIKLADSILF